MGYVPLKPNVSGGSTVLDQAIAVGTAATAFASFNTTTDTVVIQIGSNDVIVTFDATTPSATNGALLFAQQPYTWNAMTARFAKFVQSTSSSRIYLQELVTAQNETQMPVLDVLKNKYALT